MSRVEQSGHLKKMSTTLEAPVRYELVFDTGTLPINPAEQPSIRLEYTGQISCIHCGRITNKSFSQGYCYPCFKALPECDTCIMSPEKCHYDEGTCRDAAWGESYCMTPHFVYLANSSGVKVGITRENQIPTRWMDQGAIQAMAVCKVATRKLSGLVEAILRQHVTDRTRWQAMLKGDVEHLDMKAEWITLYDKVRDEIDELKTQYGDDAIEVIAKPEPIDIEFPVEEHPTKVKSFNLDKTATITGVLKGIKGQ